MYHLDGIANAQFEIVLLEALTFYSFSLFFVISDRVGKDWSGSGEIGETIP